MLVASTDVETSGLSPSKNQILSLAIVIDNLSVVVEREVLDEYLAGLPTLHLLIYHEEIVGHPYALSMNQDILMRIAARDNKYGEVVEARTASSRALSFLRDRFSKEYKVNFAGKNVAAFDIPFISNLMKDYNNLYEFSKIIRHRALDPGSLFLNPFTDTQVPDLALCLRRAGFPSDVKHEALPDALDVLRCLRAAYHYGSARL